MILGQGVRGNRTTEDKGKAGFGRESALISKQRHSITARPMGKVPQSKGKIWALISARYLTASCVSTAVNVDTSYLALYP